LWHEFFANDEAELNGQRFVFKPRPTRPKFLIGGAAPHAIERAVKLGDGWMPAEDDPDKLSEPIAGLSERMMQAGKSSPDVITLTGLPLDDSAASTEKLSALADVGVTGIVHAGKYKRVDDFKMIVEQLLEARSRAGIS
jgi:alkanesulfonate monooxygenase SsuD/methylene tetrahydromethanopterin reductase-like flavin-dependent oxidoreductase (luciferase family)